jgi:biopolymer transport protein ExbD
LNRRILERDLGHADIDVLAEGLNVVAVSTTAVVVSSPVMPPIVAPSPPTLVIRPNGGEYEISIEASGVLVASWSISEMPVPGDLAELAAVLADHTGPQVFIAASPDVPFSVIVHVMDVAREAGFSEPVLAVVQ